MPTFLEFEKPIAELEGKIEELRHLANADDMTQPKTFELPFPIGGKQTQQQNHAAQERSTVGAKS
jgi:acetyl-CoA carboxylase alpha subunit